MKKLRILFGLIGLALLLGACSSNSGPTSGKVIKSAAMGNNLTASLATADGALRHGDIEFTLSFADASGKPVEVGAVGLNFYMPPMGTMPAMNNAATFTTGSPGVYHGKVKLESAGDWQAQISYEGAAGRGKSSLTVTAQ